MADIGKKQRVIGIRHTLRTLKDAGLVEEESHYPKEAVKDVQSEILLVAERWYAVGAKRGALEILGAFLNGDFEVRVDKNGKRKIIANIDSVTWDKRLNVTVGNKKEQVPKQTYELTLEELEFDT
jgi:hypothetical protein